MNYSLKDIRVLRRNGIKLPIILAREAKRAGVELAVAAAVIEQETGGGRNVYGHDRLPGGGPPIWHGSAGNVPVTKKNYALYRAWRDKQGRPPYGRMQGVGPMQLTWYAYQDTADTKGGCWKPRINVRVGLQVLARAVNKYGVYRALKAYNGSAEYADAVTLGVRKWRKLLYVEPRQGFSSLDESLWQAYSIGRKRGFTDLGTYANKPGSHGFSPACAFDLGDPLRFKFLGWGYLKARRLTKHYAANGAALGLEYILLGKKILHREDNWKPKPFADRDGSHAFHIHADGVGPDDAV